MKTSDVEKKIGLTKQTILYYEKVGLIHPNRNRNDYRDYSEADIQTLMTIKLLRSMNIGIDDIQLVLNQQLSFQDCLKTQSQLVQQTIEEVHKIKQSIDFYKDKNFPLIPALQQIANVDEKTLIGYKHTTPNASINRRLTSSFLRTKLLSKIITSLLLGIASYLGYIKVMNENNIYIFIGVSSFMFFVQIISYGTGLGEMNSFSITQNSTLFIEFDETGVNYHKKESFCKELRYALLILRGKDIVNHANYEDITKVIMTHVKRYMRISGTNFPTRMDTIDYQFNFQNADILLLINPIILDQDKDIIHIILKEKVNQVITK